MPDTQGAAEERHLVGTVVLGPNPVFETRAYEALIGRVLLHIWGDVEFPKECTLIALVEGEGPPVESEIGIMRMTLSDLQLLLSAYKAASGKSVKDEGPSRDNAILLAFGSSLFCQATIRYWAAEPEGVSPWGSTLLGMLENAPPATFAWWDGKGDEAHKEDIRSLVFPS